MFSAIDYSENEPRDPYACHRSDQHEGTVTETVLLDRRPITGGLDARQRDGRLLHNTCGALHTAP